MGNAHRFSSNVKVGKAPQRLYYFTFGEIFALGERKVKSAPMFK